MLNMLKFNKEQQNSEINIPPYSSCPALKIDPRTFLMQQHQNSFNAGQDPSHFVYLND